MGAGHVVIFVFVLNFCEVYIFYKNLAPESSAPVLSTFLFSVATFLLLLKIPLYPSGFRKLDNTSNQIIQCFVAIFLMEFAMTRFWFPLQEYLMNCLSQWAKIIVHSTSIDLLCFCLCPLAEFLDSIAAFVFASYLLSIFFLLSSIQATRYLDLRIIRCGMNPFLKHVKERFVKDLRKIRRSMRIYNVHSDSTFCSGYTSSSQDESCSSRRGSRTRHRSRHNRTR